MAQPLATGARVCDTCCFGARPSRAGAVYKPMLQEEAAPSGAPSALRWWALFVFVYMSASQVRPSMCARVNSRKRVPILAV